MVRQTKVTQLEPLPESEEDLFIREAIKAVITEELDVEANSTNGETFMEAQEAIIKEQGPKLQLDEPELEKHLEDIILQ